MSQKISMLDRLHLSWRIFIPFSSMRSSDDFSSLSSEEVLISSGFSSRMGLWLASTAPEEKKKMNYKT